MDPTSPNRHDADLPKPDDETGVRALARARALYGDSARVVESPDLEERVKGHRYQVGVLRQVRRQVKGKKALEAAVFIALGRGATWDAAFEDAEKFRLELSAAMPPKAVDDLNRAYKGSLKVNGKMKKIAKRGLSES